MRRKAVLIILIVATLLWLAFIYSNSAKNGEQSSEQSSNVTEVVNKVADAVGIEKEITNSTVRDMAHFAEFAILAALLFSDTVVAFHIHIQKRLWYMPIASAGAVVLCFGLAAVDELLQKLSDGRACQFSDMMLDTLGALCGVLICSAVYLGIFFIMKRRKNEVNE